MQIAFLWNPALTTPTALEFAPVLYETFLLDFVESGESPIMTESQYKLIYSLIALTGTIAAV